MIKPLVCTLNRKSILINTIDLFRPNAPENGLIKVQGPLTVGKMIKFHCNPGFMMKGQPIMTCNEATDDGKYIGKWIGEVYIHERKTRGCRVCMGTPPRNYT